MLILLAVSALLTLLTLGWLAESVKHHGMGRLTRRFLLGHPMNGQARTDCGYFRRGSKATGGNRASKWHHLPHAHRAGIRVTMLAGTGAACYGYFTARSITEIGVSAVAVCGIAYGLRKADKAVKLRIHVRGVTGPLAATLAPLLGISYEAALGVISVRPGYAKSAGQETIGTVVLPDNYAANPGQREAIDHLLRTRLGVEIELGWHVTGHPKTLSIIRAAIPPVMWRFADALPVIRALGTGKILLGVTGKGSNKVWDLTREDPHMFVSANTRRGKTRLLLLIVTQFLHQGAERVTAIDPKRVGIDTALAGIPGVDVHCDPGNVQDFWDAIARFRVFMDTRIKQYAADRTLTFPRALLVIDEVSQFAAQSRQLWDRTRKVGQPAIPPVWDDLAAVCWQGAQFGCHVLVFGQRIDHRTLGGMIDSFGTRLLAGYQKNTYERLVGIPPMPASQKPRGRFLFYNGGEYAVFIQVPYGEDIELRAWALSSEYVPDTIAELAIDKEIAQ